MTEQRVVLVPEGLAGERVDTAIARMFGVSRTRAADLISSGHVQVDGADRPEAESRGGDRHDSRSASGVEHAAALEPRQRLDARARRGMCARAERATRIDDHYVLVLGRGEPRRADPETARPDGTMELLPAILPAGLDPARRNIDERCAEVRLPHVVREHSKLGRRTERVLLEPGWKALEEPGRRALHLGRRHAYRDAAQAAQRNALLSRWKKPSPSSSRDTYASGPSSRSTSSRRRRCSGSRTVGTATSSRT